MGVFSARGRAGQPTVEDLEAATRRDWLHVSPSQIKAFGAVEADGCASRWYASTILGLKSPEKPHLALGKKCHEEAEAYLLTGEAPGEIIAAGLEHLPASPVAPELVEQHFAIDDLELRPFVIGAIDLEWPGEPVALDHKTTSGFKYVKTPEQLAADAQAAVYGARLAMKRAGQWGPIGTYYRKQGDDQIPYPIYRLSAFSDAPITFRHVYYRTRRPASRVSEYTFGPGELWSRWIDTVRAPVRRMTEIVDAAPDLADVPYNLARCRDYGGCHLRGICAAMGRDSLGSASGLFKQTTDNEKREPMDLLAKLRAKKAAQAAEAETPTEAEADAPLSEEAYKPTINPPDGVAHGEAYTPPGDEPAAHLDNKDPVIPADYSVPYAGERVIGLRKKQLIETLPAIRALALHRGMPADAQHTGRCPADMLGEFKRTALRDDCHGFLKWLEGSWSAEWYEAAKLAAKDDGIPDKVKGAIDDQALSKEPAPETETVQVDAPPEGATHREPVTSPEPTKPAEPAQSREPGPIQHTPTRDSAAPPPDLSVLLIDCYPRAMGWLEPVYFERWFSGCVSAVEDELKGDWLAEGYRKGERGAVAYMRQMLSSGELAIPPVLVVRRDAPGAEYAIPALIQLFEIVIEGVR